MSFPDSMLAEGLGELLAKLKWVMEPVPPPNPMNIAPALPDLNDSGLRAAVVPLPPTSFVSEASHVGDFYWSHKEGFASVDVVTDVWTAYVKSAAVGKVQKAMKRAIQRRAAARAVFNQKVLSASHIVRWFKRWKARNSSLHAVPKLANIAQEVMDKRGTLVWEDDVVDAAPFVSVVPFASTVPLGVTFAPHHTVQVIADDFTHYSQPSPRVQLSAAQTAVIAQYSNLSLTFPCAWDALDCEILQEIGSYLLPSEEAVCVRACRRWFDAFDGNPRWKAIFEAMFWSGSQLDASMESVNCGYRQVWGVAQSLSRWGFGQGCSSQRNLAILCGEFAPPGTVHPSHCAGTVALLQYLLSMGARPTAHTLHVLAALPTYAFTPWSRLMFDLLLKSDPHLPRQHADAIVTALFCRNLHSKSTFSVCSLILPLHSSCINASRPSDASETAPGMKLSGKGPIGSSKLEAPPLVQSILSSCEEHNDWLLAVVKLLIDRQPTEFLRCSMSVLLCSILRTCTEHNGSTVALVDAVIDSFRRLDSRLITRTDAVNAAASEITPASRRGVSRGTSSLVHSPVSAKSPSTTKTKSKLDVAHAHIPSATANSIQAKVMEACFSVGEALRLACGVASGHTASTVAIVRSLLRFDSLGLTSRAHSSYSSHDGRMPIHIACATGQHSPFTVEILLLLLGSGSRSMATSLTCGPQSGRQPIHFVIARENHNESSLALVETLLKSVDVGLNAPDPEFSGLTCTQVMALIGTRLTPCGQQIMKLLAASPVRSQDMVQTPTSATSAYKRSEAVRRATRTQQFVSKPATTSQRRQVPMKAAPKTPKPQTLLADPLFSSSVLSNGVATDAVEPSSSTSRQSPASFGDSDEVKSVANQSLSLVEMAAAVMPFHEIGGGSSSAMYNASVDSEVQDLLDGILDTGRHGYAAPPEVAELLEAIEIKEYEEKSRADAVARAETERQLEQERQEAAATRLTVIELEKTIARTDAEKAREHAAEIERLAQQQKQLEEEQRLLADVEAAADMYARKRRADVRRKTMTSVKSLKQAILQGRARGSLMSPVKPLSLEK